MSLYMPAAMAFAAQQEPGSVHRLLHAEIIELRAQRDGLIRANNTLVGRVRAANRDRAIAQMTATACTKALMDTLDKHGELSEKELAEAFSEITAQIAKWAAQ